jgi:hypothetical protein
MSTESDMTENANRTDNAEPTPGRSPDLNDGKTTAELARLADVAAYISASYDHSMRMIVDLIEDGFSTGASIPVTLFVGGTMVSGELVSTETYWGLFAEKWRRILEDGGREPTEISELLESIAANGKGSEEKESELRAREEATGIPRLRSWLSLKNARAYAGVVAIPEEGALMRIRTSSIAGFMAGGLIRNHPHD